MTTTTTKYRYTLKHTGREDICPNCGQRRYVHYIDTQTGKPLPYQYGRCNREISCGYHLNPYVDGYGREDKTSRPPRRMILSPFLSQNRAKRDNYPTVPFDVLKSTQIEPLNSTFAQSLIARYGRTAVEAVFRLYFIGCYREYTTFPFIDENAKIQTIQCKRFNTDLHTDRGRYGTTFLHAIIKDSWTEEYRKRDKFVTCLFGQHLLRLYPNRNVVLVEAPKSAIVGMLTYGLPGDGNPVWLATYNSTTYSEEKVSCLAGRKVTIFADTSDVDKTFAEWESKTRRFESLFGGNWECSTILQEYASDEEKKKGYDIADYLLSVPIPEPPPAPVPVPVSVPVPESVSIPEPVPEHTAPTPVPKISTTLNGISEERKREIEEEFNVKTEQDYIFANYLFETKIDPHKQKAG